MNPFFYGFILSLSLYYSVCKPDCPFTFNRVKTCGKTLHLHHWLISVMLMFVFEDLFIRGLLFGGVFHGITSYEDWSKIYY